MELDLSNLLHNLRLVYSSLTSLQCFEGISKVTLHRIDGLDLTPLASSQHIRLVKSSLNSTIVNVSPLANVQEVWLEALDKVSPDLHILSGVQRLTIIACRCITKYPTPIINLQQEWCFKRLDINDLTGYGVLKKFTIWDCTTEDFRPLSTVSELSIKVPFGDDYFSARNVIRLPSPSGCNQDWTFIGIFIGGFIRLQKNKLKRLHFAFCDSNPEVQDLHHIQSLELYKCNNFALISNCANIESLSVVECYNFQLLNELTNVHNIRIENCGSIFREGMQNGELNVSESANVQSLEIIECLDSPYSPLDSFPFVLNAKMFRILHTLVIKGCGWFNSLHATDTDSSSDFYDNVETLTIEDYLILPLVRDINEVSISAKDVSNYAFNNISLRAAVKLWCTLPNKAKVLYGDISRWNVSQVTDMSYLFCLQTYFNDNINTWDVSNVTDMSYMFFRASSFNQPVDHWDVRNVVDMSSMFHEARSFSQSLQSWDMTNVYTLTGMLCKADAFVNSSNLSPKWTAHDWVELSKDTTIAPCDYQ